MLDIKDLQNFFESVYNESLQKLTEINKDNFWAKISSNKTGAAYAQSILQGLQKFFADFKNELQKDGIAFSSLNLVDYNVVAA